MMRLLEAPTERRNGSFIKVQMPVTKYLRENKTF